jgi:hypothetical protein
MELFNEKLYELQRELMEMKLSDTDKSFIAEYISNGFNGTQAYLNVKPNIN